MSPDIRNTGDGTAPVTEPSGCWVAFFRDRSAAVVFLSEISALRYAKGSSMEVEFRQWGQDVFTGEDANG